MRTSGSAGTSQRPPTSPSYVPTTNSNVGSKRDRHGVTQLGTSMACWHLTDTSETWVRPHLLLSTCSTRAAGLSMSVRLSYTSGLGARSPNDHRWTCPSAYPHRVDGAPQPAIWVTSAVHECRDIGLPAEGLIRRRAKSKCRRS